MNNTLILTNAIKQIYRWIIVIGTFALFVIVAYNVTRRYVFNHSVAWADEVSRFTFIWLNLLGMISVFQNNELISLDIFTGVITKRVKHAKKFFLILEFIAIAVVLGMLSYYGLVYLFMMRHVSATLALPMRFVYSVLPISTICMFIGNIIKFIAAMLEDGKN